ncbi:asparagine synthase-related protein [Brevundimonas sp. FT23042]|uniref:asparagine synthase-related protein n=1 Tax=Brevundimonas sp. FT23042 TaxID=3393749 RepID=UPI003B587830
MGADSAIILVGDDPASLADLVAPMMSRLESAGWSQRVDDPYVRVFSPTAGRLDISRALDGHGVLLGEVFDQEGGPVAPIDRRVLACRRLDVPAARAVVGEIWGRYLLVRRVDGKTAILRDPSGALEAVTWRKRGVTLVSTTASAILDPWLPDDVAIDLSALGEMVRGPGEYRHRLALTGLTPVAAGELRVVGSDQSQAEQVWSPADIYRAAIGTPPPDLRAVVELAVRALAGERTWVAEVSGGLDSAIVAHALRGDQQGRVAAWVNHYVDQPEGDERAYARPVVAALGARLTEVRRAGLGLSADRLALSAEGFRPAINDMDPDYNDDIARRIDDHAAWGSLTGQGGDAVFFQMPSPLIAFDEVFEQGLRTRLPVIHRVARWTRRSLWPGAWWRTWRDYRKSRSEWSHPWTADLRGVPPAKATQISILAFCQTFQGQAMRSRQGSCINPLLSQPVMEAGLAWSAVDLTWGGRDRAAARRAFADVLPEALLTRRSKGELGAYYGEGVAENLPFLRDYILNGRLAEAGLLDPDLGARMNRDVLLWRGGFSQLISLALAEAWLRRWTERLSQRV